MARRKAATSKQPAAQIAAESVEPRVVVLAGQLGTLLGRMQNKADRVLENDALRKQVTQIRHGAAGLVKQVNRAGAAARKAVAKRIARKPVAKKRPAKATNRSGGTVDAPGKRHRKPPPQELLDKRLGEPMGKQMGQKSVKNRMRSGRG